MPSHAPGIPETFRGEAPLFPLPNVVVFPHSVSPLRVFESRYREMFEDALAGDKLIAMATLLPGYEADYHSRPPIAPTTCLGRIGEHRRNEDGTYDFVLIGLQRAKIDHEITPVRSYRRAALQLLTEAEIASDEEAKSVGRRLVAKAAKIIPQFQQVLQPLESGELSFAAVTDAVAHHLPLDLQAKLELLDELDPVARARQLIASLSEGESTRGKPPPFSLN